jgi:glycosyltransferase involved in cell wall biosynthesis
MAKSGILIISPSGNFYGSEQVLFDYLSHTTIEADVAVPADSTFEKKLIAAGFHHKIQTFQASKLISYYLQLLFKLFFNRYRSVYLNEAGHVKYILLLSKLFPKKKFVIHVRISEDAIKERWTFKPGKNVTILAISKYIAQQISYPSVLLYDPYPFGKLLLPKKQMQKEVFKIGIIGRITNTKGMNQLVELLSAVKLRNLTAQYKFHLFGNMSQDAIADGIEKKLKTFDNVILCGFESSKEKIYAEIDCVMHLSMQEPLGRIFLETVDAEKPFIGINAAGIGEIATLLGIKDLMANPVSKDLTDQLIALMEASRINYTRQSNYIASQKKLAAKIFNLDSYTQSIDKLLIE